MASFNLTGTLSNINSVIGDLTIRAIGKKGRILDSASVSTSGDYSLEFDSDSLLKKKSGKTKKKGKFLLELVDNNGSSANYVTNEGNINLFPEVQSQKIKFKNGESSSRVDISPTGVAVPDSPDFSQVVLTNFADIYAVGQGGTVFTPGDFTSNGFLMTAENQLITGPAGTLGGSSNDNPYADGQRDSITDPSTTDADEVRVESNRQFNLQNSLANLLNMNRVETFSNNALNDESQTLPFAVVKDLKTMKVEGTFDQSNYAGGIEYLSVLNWLDTGASTFDFEGVTNGRIGLDNQLNDEQTGRTLLIKAGQDADYVAASNGDATMHGFNGADEMYGSLAGKTYVEGGNQQDKIFLLENAIQDTVSFQTITTTANGDTVNNFLLFADPTNAAGTFHDILEFDAATFSNYDANQAVIIRNVDVAETLADTQDARRSFIVDDFVSISNADFSNQGGGWLAYAFDQNLLYFASNGDFANNRQQIGEFTNDGNNMNGTFFTAQNVSIV